MKRRGFLKALGLGLAQLALPKPAIAGLLTDGSEIDFEPTTALPERTWRVVTATYDRMLYSYAVKFAEVRQRVQAR